MKREITEEQIKNVTEVDGGIEDGEPYIGLEVEFQDGTKEVFNGGCVWGMFGYATMWLEVPFNHPSRLAVVEFINSCIED